MSGSASRSNAPERSADHFGHWGLSILLHGGLIGLLALFGYVNSQHPDKKTSRWDISLLEAPPPSPAAAKPKAAPVQRPAPAKPEPAPKKAVAVPKTEPASKKAVVAPATPKPVPPTSPQWIAKPPAEHVVKSSPPAVAPPPASTQPEEPTADSDWLSNALLSRINSHKRYPMMARRMGIEGTVLIVAVIDGNGAMLSAKIVQSSGSDILDDDALALLKAATPLHVTGRRLADKTTLRIPITYALDY